QSLTRIWEQYRPRRIFIEASGVADPTAILPVLSDSVLAGVMKLEKIVTVLDADFWEARENFGRLFYNQLETAHLILLNKVDEVNESLIPAYLKEIHAVVPGCQVVPTIHCNIDPATLWSPAVPRAVTLKPMHLFNQIAVNTPGDHHDHGPDDFQDRGRPVPASNFVTFAFEDSRIMDKERFLKFIARLPWEVFRMKGPVRFSDRTEIVNFVGGKGEWSEWDGESATRLAFIGWNVKPAEILAQVARCVL
ncbi:MAG: GTP-binding protein, partial [Desulfobacterales bacterium]